MQNNRWRKGLAVGLIVIAVVIPNGELAWALSGAWTAKTSMPTGRWALGAGVVRGILSAVGGYAGPDNAVEAYDPRTNTWTTKTPMPTGRYALGVGVVNGSLYAVGATTAPISIRSKGITRVPTRGPRWLRCRPQGST